MSVLPLFYYPTTVVWVDDDALLLQVATEILGKELNIQTFTSPIACLNFFSTYESYLAKVPFLCGQEDSDDYETINHLPVDLDTAVFASFPEQAGRKNEISVIITDYNMPDISGIALCRELKKMPAKKILLTGDADTAQAIAAFNEGIIDCYIRKDSPNLVEEIKSYVSALQKEYLNDQTKSLLSYFEVDKKMPYSDSVFAAFFESWRKENAIQEHFIFDKQGNMQLVDTNGRKSFFILHTDTTLNAFCELYQENEDAGEYVDAVAKREKIPYFGMGMEAWQYKISEWRANLFEPDVLEGRETYYWYHLTTFC